MRFRTYLTLCYLFIYNVTYTQSNSNFQLIKETEGLPIGSVINDKNGQMWISTYTNGLMRYNGNEIIKFETDPNDPNSIQGEEIVTLYEDNVKNIWICTGTSGSNELIRFNPISKKIKKYNFHTLVGKPTSEKFVQIIDIKYIQNKLLFTVAFNSPLQKSILYFDPAADKLKVFAPKSKHPDYSYLFIQKSGDPTAIVLGHDNQLYELSIPKDTIYKMPFTELQSLANNAAPGVPITYDASGKLWILSNNTSLFCFDDIHSSPIKMYSFKHLAPTLKDDLKSSKHVALDKYQNIWISTSNGLLFLDKSTEKFTKMEMPLDVKGRAYLIYGLFFDSFNNLWIATETGLLKYENKPTFTNYVGKSVDSNLQVKGYVGNIKQRKDGSIGIISGEFIDGEYKAYAHSLNLQNNTMKHAYITQLFPKGVALTGMNELGKDTFFIGTDRGTYLLTNNFKAVSPLKLPGVPNIHPGFTMLHKDRFQNEWLGSLNYLYSKMYGADSFKPLDLSKQPGGSEESNMVIVEDGKHHGLWILTPNGLFLYSYSTKQITRHGYDTNKKNGFLAQTVQNVYTEDSSDIVWIAIRNGGLNKYDVKKKTLKIYTTTHGLPHLTVSTIQADEKNKILWLGTDNGISKFDISTEKFTNYSTTDGIQGKFFSASLKSSNAHLFFGGDGLIQFNPEEIKSESLPPLVSILDIKAGNKSIFESLDSISTNTSITLNHKQNNLRIEYLVVHYADPKNNKYAYKLEGFDSEWNHVQNQNTAYYTNLNPGEYTFRLKAANNNGLWSEKDATIGLKILPPWWRTTVAYLFYLLAFGIVAKLGNAYYKQRVLQQERAQNQAKEIAQAKIIEKAYKELEVSHSSLKSTQAQLIQSEKMASLGELTAGIAHEIQNPLNFVNNFSEVNKELLAEMKDEMNKGNMADANEIANNIIANEEKINHHGKRAADIVKGMLQHSTSGSGQKEPTDLNALVDEYLRLAYHGLRAKDKSFNANIPITIGTEFDVSVGNTNIIPQDMGRVILNLITNAFYAVSEKSKASQFSKGGIAYLPTVIVSTKKEGNKVLVTIQDNGNGISQKIIDKIFQPFFTTKPTGQGTGLGLSLAYDIVTKGHEGSLEVESTEGVGSKFIIQLPIK